MQDWLRHSSTDASLDVQVQPERVQMIAFALPNASREWTMDLHQLNFAVVLDDEDSSRSYQDSLVDVALVQLPSDCTPKACDTSPVGIGKFFPYNHEGSDKSHPPDGHLELCHDRRLILDRNKFSGYHSTLKVFPGGTIRPHLRTYKYTSTPKDYSANSPWWKAWQRNQPEYALIVANCNSHSHTVLAKGPIVVENAHPFHWKDFAREWTYPAVSLTVFLVCTLSWIRIRCRRRRPLLVDGIILWDGRRQELDDYDQEESSIIDDEGTESFSSSSSSADTPEGGLGDVELSPSRGWLRRHTQYQVVPSIQD